MKYSVSDNGFTVDLLGIPMILPYTWEENIAANMTLIPLWEFFPGTLVTGLYKAYRAGIDSGAIKSWNTPTDQAVSYISGVTGKSQTIVRDFLDAMVKTVAQGKASRDVIAGKAPTGIQEKAGSVVSNTAAAVKAPIAGLAVAAVAGLVLYGMLAGFLPKPKFEKV
jgi:hypothetical protein